MAGLTGARWFAAAFALAAWLGCGDDGGAKDDNQAGRDGRDDAGTEPPPERDSGTPDAGRPPVTGDDSWPMMGGDARNWYWNGAERTISKDNAAMLTEKWRFTVAGFPPGSPVIVDGQVFVMATGGTYALRLDDGTLLWERLDLRGTASVAHGDGFVYVHTSPGDLYKLDAENGETVWGPVRTYELSNCDGTSSPIVGAGVVVVGHSCGGREVTVGYDVARGGVEAFDLETGERVWSYYTVPETGENGAMVWSSVAIDPDSGTVFATTGNNYSVGGPNSDAFHAVDAQSGTLRWKLQVREGDVWSRAAPGGGQDTDFGANPILAEIDGRAVVAAGDKGSAFWVLERDTGALLWARLDLTGSHSPATGGVLMNGGFDGRDFYVISNDPATRSGMLFKLDGETGENLWTVQVGKTNWGAPSIANGVVFAPFGEDLYVLDADTGEQLTMFETGGTIAAGAASVAEGRVVVQSGLQYGFAQVTYNNQIICYGLP